MDAGNVSVDGGTLILSQSSTVTGNIEGINGASIVIEESSLVEGNVRILISGPGSTLEIIDSSVNGDIEILDIDSLTLSNTIFGGNIISTNTGILTITGSNINGDTTSQNDGEVTITGNIVNGNLAISGSTVSCTGDAINNAVTGNTDPCP